MINYAESIGTVISKELEKENDHLFENTYPFTPVNVLRKKANRRSSFKNKIPLCNWTLPTHPEGYIRAGKYDLL